MAVRTVARSTPKDKFVKANGLRLHYVDWGGKSPNVVVLLHGLNGNGHNWDPFAERICHDFRVLALDERGHSDSDHAKDGYPITAFASDVYEFAKALGIIPFDFIGHSLGGRIGIAYGGEYSSSLKHLVIVDFGAEIARREAARGVMQNSGATATRLGFNTEEEVIEQFRAQTPGRSLEEYQQRARYSLRLNWAGKLVWKHDPELFWTTGSAGAKEVPYLWGCVPRTTCPTLLMRGETSNIFARETMDKMAAMMPKVKTVEVKGAGHGIPQDQPDEFERLIRGFLAT